MPVRFIQSRADKGHAAWEVEVPVNGRRAREYLYTETEAKERENALLTQKKLITKCFIDDAVTEFYDNVAKKNVGHKNEKLIFNRAIIFFVKKQKLSTVDEIRYKHLEKLVEHLRETYSLSNASINRHFACYKSFFVWAMKMEYIEKNPAALMGLQPVDDVTRAGATEAQYLAAQAKCPDYFKRAAQCVYLTALRGVTVSNIRWRDIKDDWFEYRVRKGYRGKSVVRRFPMIPQLKGLFQAQGDYLKANGIMPTGDQYVFLNSKFKRLTAARISKLGNAAIKAAGIEGLEFYDLRYALAQDLQAAGVDLEKIRQLLGHAGVKMTRHYAGPMEMGQLSEAVQSVRHAVAIGEVEPQTAARKGGSQPTCLT